MKKVDRLQNLSEFLKENFDIEKAPFRAINCYFNSAYANATLGGFLDYSGWDLLRIRDLGEKGYVNMCEAFRKKGFNLGSEQVFNLYKFSLKNVNRKRSTLEGYLRPRRIALLKGLVKELKRKAPGFVSDDKKFSNLLSDLEKLIKK